MRKTTNDQHKIQGLTIEVKNGKFESALRKLKKRVDEDGRLQDVRDRTHFEKPSQKRRRAKELAVMRTKRDQRAQQPQKSNH